MGPGRKGAGLAPMDKPGCLQGMGSGGDWAWPLLNALLWLSALGGAASRGWERASGFGSWDSWPPGGSFSQASLAGSPAAAHTQDRLSQHSQPAGPYSEPCHVMGTGLSSGLVTKRPGLSVPSARYLLLTLRSHTLVLGIIICREDGLMSIAANGACSDQCIPTVSLQSSQRSCNWSSLSPFTDESPRAQRWHSLNLNSRISLWRL